MNPITPAVVLSFVLGGLMLRASEPVQQTFIGEISWMETMEERPEALEVGSTVVRHTGVDDEIVAEGRDWTGKPWSVYIRAAGGMGLSVAWTADLDDDEKPDPVFVHSDVLIGRCTTRSRLTTILVDADGRPTPWELEGHYVVDFSWDPPKHEGVMDWADFDGDGSVELIQRECYSYSYQDLSHNVYGLVDVYEARRGYWHRLSVTERKDLDATYLEAAKREHDLRPRPEIEGTFVPDYSNDRTKGRETTISKFIPKQESCGALKLPPFESRNGETRMTEPTEEWRRQQRERCEDRFILADGTDCYGKPAIVMNRTGESIAAMDGNSKRAHGLMDEIIEENLLATLTGQLREGLCSPAIIWAQERPNS